jgi:hypothetical protein
VVYICGRQFAFVDGNNAAQTEAFIWSCPGSVDG